MTRKIRVTVFNQEKYDGPWPPDNLQKAIDWFQAHLSSIPMEHRAFAGLEIESNSGYEGAHYPTISIYYDRNETLAEETERQLRVKLREEATQAEERRLYEQLKQKFDTA